MKYIKKFFNAFTILVILVFGFNQKTYATHIVGGDMSYRHVNGDLYEVTLTLRRDCFLGSPDAEFDPVVNIAIFSSNGNLLTHLANNGYLRINYTGNDTLNPFIRSDCGFEGTQVCVQEAVYKSILTLPFRPGGYILAYQRCCRNETLANIVYPLLTGATYWIHVTESALRAKNSSPKFIQWPDVYICSNKPLVFDHSAVDPEGDSLVYRLCLPNKGATRERPNPPVDFSNLSPPPFPFVTWNAPYNLLNLMGGDPLRIDPQTGVLTAGPNLVGQFLIGICVDEYRDGQLISTVTRDFQYNVRICSQPPKAVFDVASANCSGLDVTFDNKSLSASNYRWYFDWPNQDPAFFSTEKNPTFTYPTSGVYNVKLRATRGTDGCFDSIIQPISVFENTIVPNFTYRLDECDVTNEKLTLLLTDLSTYNQPGYSITGRNWTVIQNNDTTTYSGLNVLAQVEYTGEIKISLEIITDSECVKTIEQIVDPNVLVPRTEFSYKLEDCVQGNIARLRLTDLSAPLNPFGVIGAVNWIVNGVGYSGSNIVVPVDASTTDITITQTVAFVSSCTIEKIKNFNLQSILPKAGYNFTALGCDDDTSVNIQLSYDNQNALGYDLASGNWTINIDGNTQMLNGPVVSLTIPKDKLLDIKFAAIFSNGCTDTIADAFIPGPYPTLVFADTMFILCPGQTKSILLNANPAWDYIWSPETGLDLSDPNNPMVIATDNIVYNVTVTDGLCSATGKIDVKVLGTGVSLSISGNENTCDGSVELVVTGGVGEGVYSWSDQPNISNIIGTGDTLRTTFTGRTKTFYAIFTGESCSTEPALFTVTNQTPSVITPSPYRICPGDSISITVFNEIPGHTLIYQWENHPYISGPLDLNKINVKVDENETQDFVLYVTISNQFGCSKLDSIYFDIDQNPVADFTYELKECGDQTICFEFEGNPGSFILWNFGDPGTTTDVSNVPTPCYTYPAPGTYQVTLTNLSNVCPFKPVTKEVVLYPDIIINPIPSAMICEESEVSFTASANIDEVTYSWCTLDGVQIFEGKTLKVTVDKDTSFIIKVKDAYGCEKSDTVEVTMFEFNYTLDIPENNCRNQVSSVQLNIDNPQLYDFEWLPNDCIAAGNQSANPSIIAIQNKVYSIRITHIETGCFEQKDFTIPVPDPLSAAIEGPESFCFEQNGQLEVFVNGQGNYQYNWSPQQNIVSGQNTSNPIFLFSDNTTVQVIITDQGNGCQDTFNYTQLVNPPLEIDVEAAADVTIYEGKDIDIFVVNPNQNETYIWSTGASGTTITVSPTDNTTYIVTVTDENGCTGTDEIQIEVRKAKCDESDIFIPNAFSPNGDQNNQILYVRSNFLEELDFIIYNRWGQQVFKTNDINTGWDGTFNGQPLAPDSYAFYIKARCVNGNFYEKAGNVTLFR